jgi:RNA recognition motif-containing protein
MALQGQITSGASPPQIKDLVSTLLHVTNLPISATEELLTAKFGQFGGVVSARITRDAAGRSLRAGFVEMQTAAGAKAAIDRLNLADFDGRLMSVYKALASALGVK